MRLRKRDFTLSIILKVILALGVAWLFFLLAQTASGAPNLQINYQGKLTDDSNVAVADGTYNIAFNLYTVATNGTPIWSSTTTVSVTNGLFSYMLGSDDAIDSVDFDQTLYLSVNIGGTGAPSWDGEMTPRKVLGTVPSAFIAQQAENALNLGGVASTSFVRSDQPDAIIATAASTLLNISQLGAGDILNLENSGGEVFTVTAGGRVGIGTTSPMTGLSVDGDFALTGGLYDNNATRGNSGEILQTDGAGISWVSTTTLGLFAGSSIDTYAELNALVSDVTLTHNGLIDTCSELATILSGQTTGTCGSFVLSASPTLTGTLTAAAANFSGNVGVGTTSPSSKLSVYGSAFLEGSNRYLNFGTATDTAGYGFRDNAGTMEFKNSAGSWTAFGSGGLSSADIDTCSELAAILSGETTGTCGSVVLSASPAFTGNVNISSGGGYQIGGTDVITSGRRVLTATGTEALPAFAFSGDTDTGIFSPSADALSIVTGGSERISIDSSGNLNLVSSPWLIIPDSTATAWRIGTSTASLALMSFNTVPGSEEVAIGLPGGDVLIGAVGATTNLVFEEDAVIHGQGGNTLTFGQAGDVITFAVNTGFGTSSPSTALTVYGDFFMEGSDRYFNFGTTTGTSSYGIRDNSGTLEFKNAAGVWAALGSGGGLWTESGSDIYFNTGNVGIGTTTPQSALHIGGAGEIYLGNSDTSAGGDIENYMEQDFVSFRASSTPNQNTRAFGFYTGSGLSNLMSIFNNGKVGIGTTTPSKKLSVTDTVADSQFILAYDSTRAAYFQIDSVGDLLIDASGGDVRLPNNNLWICESGSCPSITASSTAGYAIVENGIYFGNGFKIDQITGTTTELGVYNASGSVIVIFEQE